MARDGMLQGVLLLWRGRLRIVLVVVGLFLIAQAAVMTVGPMTENEEIECGSAVRPARPAAMSDHDVAWCHSAIAEL